MVKQDDPKIYVTAPSRMIASDSLRISYDTSLMSNLDLRIFPQAYYDNATAEGTCAEKVLPQQLEYETSIT